MYVCIVSLKELSGEVLQLHSKSRTDTCLVTCHTGRKIDAKAASSQAFQGLGHSGGRDEVQIDLEGPKAVPRGRWWGPSDVFPEPLVKQVPRTFPGRCVLLGS